MSVVKIEPIKEGARGNFGGISEFDVTRAFRVWTDDPFDNLATILPALPVQYGDPISPGSGLIARDFSWTYEHKGPGQSTHIVLVRYDTLIISQEQLEAHELPNPLDRTSKITVRSARYGKLTIFDRDGNVKRTSAGEIYPPGEVDATRWMANVRKNVSTIPDFMWEYQDKLNDGPVTIKGRVAPAETLKFGSVMIPPISTENGVLFYPIEFDLEFRREGWKDKRVDAGFYQLDGNDLKRIQDADGNDVVVEEWLDGNGAPLRDTIPNPQPGDETINEFDDYETDDFSVLPLSET